MNILFELPPMKRSLRRSSFSKWYINSRGVFQSISQKAAEIVFICACFALKQRPYIGDMAVINFKHLFVFALKHIIIIWSNQLLCDIGFPILRCWVSRSGFFRAHDFWLRTQAGQLLVIAYSADINLHNFSSSRKRVFNVFLSRKI